MKEIAAIVRPAREHAEAYADLRFWLRDMAVTQKAIKALRRAPNQKYRGKAQADVEINRRMLTAGYMILAEMRGKVHTSTTHRVQICGDRAHASNFADVSPEEFYGDEIAIVKRTLGIDPPTKYHPFDMHSLRYSWGFPPSKAQLEIEL